MISLTTDPPEIVPLLFDIATRGLLVIGLALVAVCFMRRKSAAARHLALSLALGSLLVLPLFSISLPRLNVLPGWLNIRSAHSFAHLQAAGRPTERTQTAYNEKITGLAEQAASTAPPIRTAPFPKPAVSANLNRQPWSVSQWIVTLWAIGACLALTPIVGGLLSLRSLSRRCRMIESGPLFDLLKQLKANANCRRDIRLLSSSARSMPMMWGLFRPTILVPEDALEWPSERQHLVLLHEFGHVERHDFATTLLTRIACALHWYNPLAWIAARRTHYEQEQACDDIVLREGAMPEAYAEEVLEFASGHSIGGVESVGAIAMARPSSLEGRLLAILDESKNRKSLTRSGVLTVTFLVMTGIAPISMLATQSASSIARSDLHKTDLDHGLVAWWRGEGNGKDSAGSHDGTFPFGERYFRGLSGGAFSFLRSYSIEDQVRRVSVSDSPDFDLSEMMTLEAWIYPLEYKGIILMRGDDREGYDAWQLDLFTEGKVSFGINSADNQGVGIHAPARLNQWQHIAAVFDHGAMRLYVNGILGAEKRTNVRPISVLEKDRDPAVGIGNAGGRYYSMPFNGIIDEVRIYNRALSEAEVDERMRR